MASDSVPQETPSQKALRELKEYYDQQCYDAAKDYRRKLANAKCDFNRQLHEINHLYPDNPISQEIIDYVQKRLLDHDEAVRDE